MAEIDFSDVPDVSFIGDDTEQEVMDKAEALYRAEYERVTGTEATLAAGSPERLMLCAMVQQWLQLRAVIQSAGRSGLLKYSGGAYLDNLGLMRGLKRKQKAHATTELRFTLSDIRPGAVGIPGGTRVAGGGLYFVTDGYMEIPAGSLAGSVSATAEDAGTDANGMAPGSIKTIVDAVPYVASVVNISTSTGGADVEADEDFRVRIYRAPEGFSVAGPEAAYRWHARQAAADIGDVVAWSPAPGNVSVVFTLSDGSLPAEDKVAAVQGALSADTVRPLTDVVTVAAPVEKGYSLKFTYYINRSEAGRASDIQQAVSAAVDEYKAWQRHIGRDISASKLIQLVMMAGAKRVEVSAPAFAAVAASVLPRLDSEAVTYGGLEDD